MQNLSSSGEATAIIVLIILSLYVGSTAGYFFFFFFYCSLEAPDTNVSMGLASMTSWGRSDYVADRKLPLDVCVFFFFLQMATVLWCERWSVCRRQTGISMCVPLKPAKRKRCTFRPVRRRKPANDIVLLSVVELLSSGCALASFHF